MCNLLRHLKNKNSYRPSLNQFSSHLVSKDEHPKEQLVSNMVQVSGSNLTYTYIVLAISLVALAIAYALRAQVLAASDGTDKMK